MQTFFFTSRCGQGLLLCDATRPPRGGSWRRQHFTRGQASIFVQSLPAHELRSLKFQLGSRYRIGALNPAAGLTQLLDSHRLSLYRKRPKPLKRQVEAPAVPSASELRLIIAASLKLIISRERAEALSLAKSHQRKSSTGKAAAHASALGQGLLASGAELVHWLGNSNDVVNPLWQLKRQVDAALITYEECSAASNGCLNLATRARYLKRVELADHQELVEALGFDPTTIDLDAFSQAWHSAWVLAGDEQVVTMIGTFAKDYIEAQHSLEYSQAAGGAVFEVLLALLLAATTAGAGVVLSTAGKARHTGELGRIGKKLMLLAGALEDLPREVIRKRPATVKMGTTIKSTEISNPKKFSRAPEEGRSSTSQSLPENENLTPRKGPDTLYRRDNRDPQQIFEEGFQPRQPDANIPLEDYVDLNVPSQYVGTSKIPAGAAEVNTQTGRPGYLYELDNPGNGVDVNEAYPENPFSHEQEIAIPGGVDSCHIKGCTPLDRNNNQADEFIPNPNYLKGD